MNIEDKITLLEVKKSKVMKQFYYSIIYSDDNKLISEYQDRYEQLSDELKILYEK